MIEMYHATRYENLESIMTEGIRTGFDGLVYLAETPLDAMKFLLIRLVQHIVVFKVIIPEEDVEETFDHSREFFKCRAFGCTRDIDIDEICLEESLDYDFSVKE
jgi:RNA:NAD 2'-phosphotransferase (TPT1/KptA family)